MAYMIPESIPYGRPNSERRVFSMLQALPDDCWVYFEPLILGRYPDFIVFIPDCGLLVIEVKGWHPQTLLGGDHQRVELRTGSAANPIRQARDYMVTLMDRARKHPAARLIVHRDGPHRGRFVFPFGYVGLLSQITDDELRNHPAGDLRQFLPSSHVVTADEFDAWADLTGAGLKARLATFFDPRWPLSLSPEQVDAIRTIVHPEVALPRTPNQIAAGSGAGQLRLPEEEATSRLIKTMDLEQERHARTLGAGHRLLFGVAGSGMTIVLLARARFLSEAL
ncbi:MAG: NERD domain-containing protein, partial [Vicinamibacteria bacterium]|nr:NERD domain-containing protein [Vicinamibacteria bacterium]